MSRLKALLIALDQLIASAVATQEATDGDSNRLLRQPANETVVAIRKQAKLAYGYRILTPHGLRWICPL